MFYSLNERKIKNFFENFQELLLEKSTNDIAVDDILEFTGISRATFYNYFNDINELYSDYIEYKLMELTKYVEKLYVKKEASMLDPISDLFASMIQVLDDEKVFTIVTNFLHSNNRIIRTAYSDKMERFISEVTKFYIANSIEGKRINDYNKVYTLLNVSACIELVALEAEVYKRLNKEYQVCNFDIGFAIKVMSEGIKAMYP